MYTSVAHHGLSKKDSVEVRSVLPYSYVSFRDQKGGRVDLYADSLDDFEVLFKQALIQIAKIRLEMAS